MDVTRGRVVVSDSKIAMISNHPILVPVLALVAWTMIVMIWMMATRVGAFKEAGIGPKDLPPGTRGPDLESRLGPAARWKADNYNHLLEQPAIFYALCLFALTILTLGRAF